MPVFFPFPFAAPSLRAPTSPSCPSPSQQEAHRPEVTSRVEAVAVEKQRRKKEKFGRTMQNSPTQRLIWSHFRVTDCWARAILSNPATVACSVCGEIGGTEIEAPLPNPSRLLRPPPSRALPKILNPARSGSSRQSHRRFFFHINTRSLSTKFTRLFWNGSRRLKMKSKLSHGSSVQGKRFRSM